MISIFSGQYAPTGTKSIAFAVLAVKTAIIVLISFGSSLNTASAAEEHSTSGQRIECVAPVGQREDAKLIKNICT